jgi:quercetin dioxygenase-like cupin family protein
VLESGEWKIGLLGYNVRFSALTEMERHLHSDEAFVLLEGDATLYTDTEKQKMEPLIVYNIPKGVWHHVVADRNARILVVENRDTSKENTEKRYL